MAALCPGALYGLSSQHSLENKELIFLKLTDSAVRAIEEYLKIENKLNFPNPKIRFLGKENGELSFPSQQNGSGQTTFNFSTSTTSDMEGPAGSFECICGTPPKGPLTSLGSIRNKIRIHANDDVYEATRNRMNEVEDKYKNKCTREIKPNQNDIGRKVKVKQSVSGSRQSSISSQPARPALPSMRDSLMKSTSYSIPPAVKPSQNNLQPSSTNSFTSNNPSNGLSSNHVSSSQRSAVPQSNRKPAGPEVSRRPLRERLIHLLALRPFKKIELHDRITKEGLRGTSSMTNVLKQIAVLRDNSYYLNRNMWNEVNDDWPFYNETEKQILKRKKPQNLTPPGGSDGGSSGSGQSPTSTHPGSPPMISSTNGLTGGTKRPGYSEGADGFPYKKQRIAHGAKGPNSSAQQPPVDGFVNYKSPVQQNNSQRRSAVDLRDTSNMNPRSRESPSNSFSNSFDNYPPPEGVKAVASGMSFASSRENTFNGSPLKNSLILPTDHRKGSVSPVCHRQASSSDFARDSENRATKVSSTSHQRSVRVSPDSQTDRPTKSNRDESEQNIIQETAEEEESYLDFKKQYVKVTSPNQKSAYKADFNAYYDEYKNLYHVIQRVAERLSLYQDEMDQTDESNPRYNFLRQRLADEYYASHPDELRAKSRYKYLYEKLSHIKNLVEEYTDDQTQHYKNDSSGE
ncbi:RNA polymerase II elongation factor Ell [Dendroctonus ponderosae]|uniref:RNA polymerase II elongation factor Ell n=1 Tax=Dendroctonus ponderosae TaxID=77166 RepID=UPI002034FD93|nr:RNA polymerase II elongation factor Ell [Dendroctonus ponderosae]